MRKIVDTTDIPWTEYGPGYPVKVKELGPAGQAIFRVVHGEGPSPAHFHLRQSFFYILSGQMVLRDRPYPAETWGLEPYAAIHPKTLFEDVLYLSWAPHGHVLPIEDLDNIPAWMLEASRDVDGYADLVNTPDVPSLPMGTGLSMQALHVFDGEATFIVRVRADAGATLPARRHLGLTDIWVLSGSVTFADGTVADKASWIREEAGTEEGPLRFTAPTDLLVTSYGAIVEFDVAGQISGIIDGSSLRELAKLQKQVSADDAASSADWQAAVARFRAASSPLRGEPGNAGAGRPDLAAAHA